MTREELLQISKPEKLFSGNLIQIKKQYRSLALLWHPDRNKENNSSVVFAHITNLYEQLISKIESGKCDEPNNIILQGEDKTRKIYFVTHKEFELGDMYIGETHITFLVNYKYEKFWNNFITHNDWTFLSDKIKKYLTRSLPNPISFKTSSHLCIQVQKDRELLLLNDVLQYYKTLDPKHVAWILNRLFNIVCYLQTQKIVHNDISLDSCFINPEKHELSLFGGWWYSTKFDEKLSHLPVRTFKYLPYSVTHKKTADPLIDLECLKACGRELLGASLGPEPMLRWLNRAADGTAIQQYKEWEDLLNKCFGPRKFHKLELNFKQLYEEN